MRLPNPATQAIILVCVAVWVVCAIEPWDFGAWLIEQFATVCALGVLGWCVYRGVHFSIAGRVTIAILFIAHTTGTHFTYSLTPYDSAFEAVTGLSLNEIFGWQRNHYDRFVHLLYGVCLALPTADVLQQRLGTSLFTSRFLALHIVLSTSAIYELVEWAAALVFGGELGALYLGTQGDIWDAQADIALAGAGQLCVYALHSLAQRCRLPRYGASSA